MSEPTLFHDGRVSLYAGDCLDVLKTLPDNSVDSVCTDPPYGLKFMGKAWDSSTTIAFRPELWTEVLRVLKPGGHCVAFGGTRTFHRMACAIEDAGFEIRDQIQFAHDSETEYSLFEASLNDEQRCQFTKLFRERAAGQLLYVFGTGFPKSRDVSKEIDKAAGAEREVIGQIARGNVNAAKRNGVTIAAAEANRNNKAIFGYGIEKITKPSTDAAREWQGWGSALKPSFEPLCVARKPLSESTISANVLLWGTGALNIDATRIKGLKPEMKPTDFSRAGRPEWRTGGATSTGNFSNVGRWPANFVHDNSDEVVSMFPDARSAMSSSESWGTGEGVAYANKKPQGQIYNDSGSAARFFASFPQEIEEQGKRLFYSSKADADCRIGSRHPTVKPLDLMRWLVRLVTPPGGLVLDLFAGTGTTGEAALHEGFRAILIEREAEYQADIGRRMKHVLSPARERKSVITKAKGKVESAGPLFAFEEQPCPILK